MVPPKHPYLLNLDYELYQRLWPYRTGSKLKLSTIIHEALNDWLIKQDKNVR